MSLCPIAKRWSDQNDTLVDGIKSCYEYKEKTSRISADTVQFRHRSSSKAVKAFSVPQPVLKPDWKDPEVPCCSGTIVNWKQSYIPLLGSGMESWTLASSYLATSGIILAAGLLPLPLGMSQPDLAASICSLNHLASPPSPVVLISQEGQEYSTHVVALVLPRNLPAYSSYNKWNWFIIEGQAGDKVTSVGLMSTTTARFEWCEHVCLQVLCTFFTVIFWVICILFLWARI